MSKSKLLKEAIADAKAVRETAIANAKIALEEAFTPRLQSILSRKLQAEMEDEEMDADEFELEEEDVVGDESPEIDAENDAEIDAEIDAELEEDEDEEIDFEMGDDSETELEEEDDDFDFEQDEDELDLESIIRELEMGSEEDSEEEMTEEEDENGDGVIDDPSGASIEEDDDLESTDEFESEEGDFDNEIDLDEILREMGYGDDEDEEMTENDDEDADQIAGLEADLEEAYKTIKSLRGTINEVNLLNAKLLYTNKLFRNYNLTNEQKVKVVENLDRTSNVREVKLVYATLSESMKFTGTAKKSSTNKSSIKKNISEGFASKKSNSTAPKKEIITENVDTLADRFKKLAGIIE
jgi:hypothetical protein